ncbi:spermidine synthase-like [Lytechinus variegatus]|uniref:spermidine synthase-like n=1 Tax=Lytechinus variegatus TaxID=7654 RepID=UPI001BB184E5|nr:spermidine synthase-like [Lytechinus variegatus]
MDSLKKGWFSELGTLWPGEAASLEVEEVLFHERSKFQDVLVFKSKTYGNVLVLDGVIQCTERDEYSYQEMITFLALNSHPCPEKVLVIGGGDGGVIREIVKHPDVDSVTQCEIDGCVVEVSKKYLPNMSAGYDSPKLTQHIGDGFAFMKENKNAFDVIITDSSDPVGPAEMLFEKEYYELMKNALKPGGIVSTQGESLWLHLDLIKSMQKFCRSLYPVVDYAFTTVPTYPSGQIGFTLCSTNPETNFREPVNKLSDEQIKKMGLRYYNSDVHKAAFVLPQFAREALRESSENGAMENNA